MDGHSPTIRAATAADSEVILRHRRAMFADMGTGDEVSREAMVRAARPFLEASLGDGSYRGWLVEDGDSVLASGGLAIIGFQPSPLDPVPRRVWILNMYTEPGCRRRGFARQLMETMIDWCRGQGIGSVFLHASDDGRPLYERLGFTPTSEMRLVLEREPDRR